MPSRQVSPGRRSNNRNAVAPAEPAEALEQAKACCLRLLGYRLRSEQELRRALAQRGIPPAITDQAIARLAELGLVNDREFAAAWVQSRLGGRALGRRALLSGLARLGVDSAVAGETVEALLPEQGETAAALELARRRLGGQTLDRQVRARLLRLLVGRGFSYPVAVEAVRGLEREQAS